MNEIRVLLLDNEVLVREGVRTILEREADLTVVEEAVSFDDHVRPAANPEVILVEPLLAGDKTQGADLVNRLAHRYPGSNILVLSKMESIEDVQRMLDSGARGYVLKNGPADGLVEAVRRVATGEEYLQPSLGAALLKASRNGSSNHGSNLTDREREVLRVLAIGHTNAEAAAILSYAVRTVEGYRARIMRKLCVESRAELVRAASELDLLHFNAS